MRACMEARVDDRFLPQLLLLSTFMFETVSLTLEFIDLTRLASQ